MKDELVIEGAYAKQYADWHIKTGGYARDMTLRDHFAGLALQALITASVTAPGKVGPADNISEYAYKMADAMLKERIK
jgi:hypothetical protein